VPPMPRQTADLASGVRCPHCRSPRAEVISLFGTQAISLQFRCEACRNVFEGLKYAPRSTGPDGDLEWPS
jgi:rubredoxin